VGAPTPRACNAGLDSLRRQPAAFVSAAAVAAAVVVLAYVVAPRSCQGGLEIYTLAGAAALLLLAGLPFVAHMGRSALVRIAIALGFLVFGTAVWLGGLLAANVRFICGLGYL
jgi:hypothetical protein